MKKFFLTESQLIEIIEKSVSKKLNEGNFSVEPDVKISPREKQISKVFGKYSGYLPDDLLRYIRKNPKLIIQRLFDIYGDNLISYVDEIINNNHMSPMMEQNYMEDMEDMDNIDDMDDMEPEIKKYPVNDYEFELSDSDINDINNQKGEMRRFRGSIYVDGLVPSTDDKEYDRKLAVKILEKYASKLPTREFYVGGVGFKQRSFMEPYDNMDF
jgi:hypothetical protein